MIHYLSVLKNKDIWIRLAIFAIGFSPIASLSLATFELIPLHISGPCIVLPAILSAFMLGSAFPQYRQTLLRGFLLGVVGVFIYDLTCRFPFIAVGVWADFIPKIGCYLLNHEHVHWSVGYLWRYIGNGGGMGLAFYAVYPLIRERVRPIATGVVYGLLVFACALATIYLSPDGRSYLFDPTLTTGLLGLLGHVVFGYTLGYGVKRFPDQIASAAMHRVRTAIVLHQRTIPSGLLGSRDAESMTSDEVDTLADIKDAS
jgi:hypothetical protein